MMVLLPQPTSSMQQCNYLHSHTPSIITQYITGSCDVMFAKPLSESHSVNGQRSLLHVRHFYSLLIQSTPYNIALNT